MIKGWLAALAIGACALGCESLSIAPADEDVATWSDHRTSAGDRVIRYRLPPDPEVRIYPRRAANLAPTSRETQAFLMVNYGYGLPEPRIAELQVVMEVRTVDGGGIDASWSAERFAQFYWARAYGAKEMISPYFPKFESLVKSELPELGQTTWYQLTYPDETRGDKISGDVFLRPISPTHVLAVSGRYCDYRDMSPEAIERRRALMRKIVAQVRVEPSFGPVKTGVPRLAPP